MGGSPESDELTGVPAIPKMFLAILIFKNLHRHANVDNESHQGFKPIKVDCFVAVKSFKIQLPQLVRLDINMSPKSTATRRRGIP